MNRSLLLVLPLALVLAACDSATPATAPEAVSAVGADARGQNCVSVADNTVSQFGAPVVIPIDPDEPLIGAGGLPFPTVIGPYTGLMSSVVIDDWQAGNGALHYRIVHYFVEHDTGDDFWTEDRAVCAPAGTDPSTCLVNTNMNVVGGRGKFASASGRLHNRGLITVTSPDESPFGTIEINMFGRVCGAGL